MKHKFKVGDKVNITRTEGNTHGRRFDTFVNPGVVRSVRQDFGQQWINVEDSTGLVFVGSDATRFVPAAPTFAVPFAKTWMITLLGSNNELQFASKPRTYVSREQANTVAKSMAERHPGDRFVVFEAMEMSVVNATVTTTL